MEFMIRDRILTINLIFKLLKYEVPTAELPNYRITSTPGWKKKAHITKKKKDGEKKKAKPQTQSKPKSPAFHGFAAPLGIFRESLGICLQSFCC